ncbi:MAG: bifunctional phosphoribosylaminoimidazolecarboxamide formyltransferase/IMP cyclohydrolase [Acidobacteriota bacterium]
MKIETALISVSNKDGLEPLVGALTELGIRILSTGGTAGRIRELGGTVTSVSDHTGFAEILDGRVKTLHPRIHAGLLARLDDPAHRETLDEQGIPPIGLLAVNLYPFVETVQRQGVTRDEAVEQIDIGGPAMIRAAAKNHPHVTVVVDPGDYPELIRSLRSGHGEPSLDFRRRLARKAFHHTACYDSAIAAYLDQQDGPEEEGALPSEIALGLVRQASLRYGENPHQKAGLYRPSSGPPQGLAAARQLQGKELSFNNYLDLQAAWELCSEFDQTACTIIKHSNPCGAALGSSPLEAYKKALTCDPLSAFGSVIACNRPLDLAAAEEMLKLFVEAIIAPGYHPDALEAFKAKKNLRLMESAADAAWHSEKLDFKQVSGGFLVQQRDAKVLGAEGLRPVTKRIPGPKEEADLLFAWKVAKHVKSNAIIFVRGLQTIGIGAGQMSRVDSVDLAARKAQVPVEGCAMASDAFFPFRDGIDQAAKAGVQSVIQPGGSVRDQEVIQAADEHGMAMLLTGMRHFRH